MRVIDALTIVATAIFSIGGAAAVIFALSGWLGRIWANRLMETDRARHALDLEKLRAQFSRDAGVELEAMKRQFDVGMAHVLRETTDKLAIYRQIADMAAEVLGDFDAAYIPQFIPAVTVDPASRFDKFNRQRMRTYGYLAMLAPQAVMDAFDALLDYLLVVATGREQYDWPKVRVFALALLNEMRKDVGIDKEPIEYRGVL